MIGFDFARPANPPERQGTASGITNMGGFVASMTTLLAIGVLLDADRRQLHRRVLARSSSSRRWASARSCGCAGGPPGGSGSDGGEPGGDRARAR